MLIQRRCFSVYIFFLYPSTLTAAFVVRYERSRDPGLESFSDTDAVRRIAIFCLVLNVETSNLFDA
jgi:hypothetical protein